MRVEHAAHAAGRTIRSLQHRFRRGLAGQVSGGVIVPIAGEVRVLAARVVAEPREDDVRQLLAQSRLIQPDPIRLVQHHRRRNARHARDEPFREQQQLSLAQHTLVHRCGRQLFHRHGVALIGARNADRARLAGAE